MNYIFYHHMHCKMLNCENFNFIRSKKQLKYFNLFHRSVNKWISNALICPEKKPLLSVNLKYFTISFDKFEFANTNDWHILFRALKHTHTLPSIINNLIWLTPSKWNDLFHLYGVFRYEELQIFAQLWRHNRDSNCTMVE